MWCSSADPGLNVRRTLHRTFVAERLARGQLDLVVAQAVLGPGLVHDLVDLLPLAELAEVAVGHCARGAAALLCAGALHPGYVPRRRRRAHRFHSAICVIAAVALVRVQAQRARSRLASLAFAKAQQLAAGKALEF